MDQFRIHDRLGYIIGASTWLISFVYILTETGDFWGSFSAALITAGLVWVTYLIILWVFLAVKSK